MKKTYINPNLVVVKIATHQMLASSPDAGLDTSRSVDADRIEGREFDFDDDDEY